MRKLHILSVFPDEIRFQWECLVALNNWRKYGYSQYAHIIVFLPAYHETRGFSPKWKKIQEWFPETKFFFYKDAKATITDLMVNYNYDPILRLCCLERHFKLHPELEKDTIMYIDSDVLFTQQPDIEQYIQDDINHLSDTHTYLNASYFDSKGQKEADGTPKFVHPDKFEEYQTKDILSQCVKFSGITREICEKNDKNTGGAQYLLKNMSSKFFSECIDSCLLIRMYLQQINQQYFKGDTIEERESQGFQSWCSDMFSIQWNLWKHNLPSQTPKFMDFVWASEEIPEFSSKFLFHNAGITGDSVIRVTKNLVSSKHTDGTQVFIDAPALFKGNYTRISPFQDLDNLKKIIEHPVSQKYCTSFYVQEILDTYNKFLINENKTEENVKNSPI